VGSAEFDVVHHLSSRYDWMSGTADGEDVVIRQEREAVTDLQVGGEYVWRRKHPLRAGLFTSFSSAPDPDPAGQSTLGQVDLYGATVSVGSIGENVVANLGFSYVWGSGDALGNRLDEEGLLESVVTQTRESGLYAFASTAYRF